jgi:TPR repeat protein
MYKYIYIACVVFIGLIIAIEERPMPSQTDTFKMYDDLAFECRREADVLPPLDRDADTLYKYGLFLEQHEGPKNFNEVAKYYRIAASHGHYKAATNLQVLISQGLASSPDPQRETIELVESAILQGIPGAYYDMAHYLEMGYGVEQDRDKANAYFRKAADLGSPDAQFYVANLLGRVKGGYEVMIAMRRCAASQGHGRAAADLAAVLRVGAEYKETVQAYQQAVKAGESASADKLGEAFDGPLSEDDLFYMALDADKERSLRYKKISEFLEENEQLGAKLPDIDAIVPLPPAQLPSWDGSFQWQKERASKKDPVKPSQDLVKRLCEEKHLDPETGLPQKTRAM